MSRSLTAAAVDLGASSGRVMLGYLADGRLRLEQVVRFSTTRAASTEPSLPEQRHGPVAPVRGPPHVVGGGCQNTLLCQSLADRSGLPVLARPVEATAIGNVLVPARAGGVGGSLAAVRDVVRSSYSPITYRPRA